MRGSFPDIQKAGSAPPTFLQAQVAAVPEVNRYLPPSLSLGPDPKQAREPLGGGDLLLFSGPQSFPGSLGHLENWRKGASGRGWGSPGPMGNVTKRNGGWGQRFHSAWVKCSFSVVRACDLPPEARNPDFFSTSPNWLRHFRPLVLVQASLSAAGAGLRQ